MLPSRQAPDLLAGQWQLLERLGAVPRALVWDNEAAVGSWRAGRPKLTEDFEGFRGALGIRIVQCRPADPEAKGLVERANGHLETTWTFSIGRPPLICVCRRRRSADSASRPSRTSSRESE